MLQDSPRLTLPPVLLYYRMNTAPNTRTPRILSGAPHIAVALPGWVSCTDHLILTGFGSINLDISLSLVLARITGTSALILPYLLRRRFPVGCCW